MYDGVFTASPHFFSINLAHRISMVLAFMASFVLLSLVLDIFSWAFTGLHSVARH